MRDHLEDLTGYGDVLRRPLDDEPRRRLAAVAAVEWPLRARFIDVDLDAAEEEVRALVARSTEQARLEELRKEALRLAEREASQWIRDRDGAELGFGRGFVERLEVRGATTAPTCLAAWDRFPLLHLAVHEAPVTRLPIAMLSRMATLVSLEITDLDDAGLLSLLETGALDSLRRLSVHGPMTIASLQALCERPLPRLEDLAFLSPNVPSPCELLFSDNWATVTGHREVERNPFGDELEARYGFKRFFHAASRLSIYPCAEDALDRLPLLDEDIIVRPRLSLGQPHRPLLPPR